MSRTPGAATSRSPRRCTSSKATTKTSTSWRDRRVSGQDPAYVRASPAYVRENLFYIPNGQPATIDGLRVAGLGGTHAPTMYQVAAADLPHPKKSTPKATEAADRRRHFVAEEVEACKGFRDVDVFLSHEAPRPFRVHRGIDAGKTPINEVLAAMRPRLHLFGHHHRFVVAAVTGRPVHLPGSRGRVLPRHRPEHIGIPAVNVVNYRLAQGTLPRRSEPARPCLRRSDGDDAVRQGHLPESFVR